MYTSVIWILMLLGAAGYGFRWHRDIKKINIDIINNEIVNKLNQIWYKKTFSSNEEVSSLFWMGEIKKGFYNKLKDENRDDVLQYIYDRLFKDEKYEGLKSKWEEVEFIEVMNLKILADNDFYNKVMENHKAIGDKEQIKKLYEKTNRKENDNLKLSRLLLEALYPHDIVKTHEKITEYIYNNLKYCSGKFITFGKRLDGKIWGKFWLHMSVLLLLFDISIITSENFLCMGFSFIFTVVLLFFLIGLQKVFLKPEKAHLLLNLVSTERRPVRDGLHQYLFNDVVGVLDKTNNTRTAYKRLKELSCILMGDDIKNHMLCCLNNLINREDVNPEPAAVIMSIYNEKLVDYIKKANEKNNASIDEKVIEYILRHEGAILNSGKENILRSVARTVKNARKKQNIDRYERFVARYNDYICDEETTENIKNSPGIVSGWEM